MASPPQLVGDLVRVTIVGTLFQQTIMTVLDYKVTESSGDTIRVVANALDATFDAANDLYDSYRAVTPPEYTHTFTWIQTIRPTRFTKSIFAVDSPGTNATSTKVSNVAAVITKRSELANRRGLGSVHMPIAPTASGVTNGKIVAPMRTLLNTLGDKIVLSRPILAGLTTLVPVIVNSGFAFPAVEYSDYITQDTSRVMRRRTVGLGI